MCDEKPQIPPPPLLSGRSPLLQRPEERKGGDTHLHFIIIYPRFPARRILWELDIIIFRGMRRRGGKRGGGGGRGRNSPEEKDGGWGGNLMSPEEEEEECGPKHLFSGWILGKTILERLSYFFVNNAKEKCFKIIHPIPLNPVTNLPLLLSQYVPAHMGRNSRSGSRFLFFLLFPSDNGPSGGMTICWLPPLSLPLFAASIVMEICWGYLSAVRSTYCVYPSHRHAPWLPNHTPNEKLFFSSFPPQLLLDDDTVWQWLR